MQKSHLLGNKVKSCGCYNRLKSRKNGTYTAWAQWFRYLKDQAKNRKLYFDLSLKKVKDICVKNCTYCGIHPQPWNGAKNQYLASCKNKKTKIPDKNFAESKVISINGIDRIDSNLGYVISNVQTSCRTCNLAKLSMSDKEFREWIIMCYNHINKEIS